MGPPRLAGGIVLAQRKGLRPGELLRVIPSDISLPEDKSDSLSGVCTIGLGMASGTKVRRPQYCILRLPEDSDIIAFLRVARTLTPKGVPIVPCALDLFRRLLRLATSQIGENLDIDFTPHSFRAGFATEARARGVPIQEVKDEGRWLSDQSFGIYVDLVMAADIAANSAHVG